MTMLLAFFLSFVMFIVTISVSADDTIVTVAPYLRSSYVPLISSITPDSKNITSGAPYNADNGEWFIDGYHFTRETPTLSSFDEIPLFLSALFPLKGTGWNVSGLLVTADLALKHINDSPDVLPGYRLFIAPGDSECNDGVAIRKFFQQLLQYPPKIAVIGAGCSIATQPIASTAHFWNLNVTMADLLKQLEEKNITIISSESFDADPTNQLENLKKQDAKIIIASMYPKDARKMFCEARKLGMYGKGYIWFHPGWYVEDWYKMVEDDEKCTVDEMIHIVGSSNCIAVKERVLADVETMTIAGITRGQYDILLHEHFQQDRFAGYNFIPETHFGYDSVWAVALALHQTAENLKKKAFEDGQHRGLETFSYSDQEMGDMLSKALENINFTGVTGSVTFHQGERIGSAYINQLQAQCGEGWRIHSGYCYLFVASQKSWDEAARFCREEESFLVSILSEDENEALIEFGQEQLNKGINQWWVSLKGSEEGDLQWSEGPERKVQWLPWEQDLLREDDADNSPDEQRRDGNTSSVNLEICYILDGSLKTWLPVECTRTLHSFICKRRAEHETVVLATYNVETEEFEWVRDIVWPGGVFPLDHTPVVLPREEQIYEGISFVIYIVTCSAAICGILFAIVCLIFNFTYRKQIFIKMSSPNLNSLIIIGCILIYVSACMAGWESASVDRVIFLKLQQMKIWCSSVGFVLSFGSMFSKTWRVHKIAALKNPKRVIVTDRHLFMMVGAFLFVEVAILSAWFIISPMRVEKIFLPKRFMDIDGMVILQPYIQYSTSDHEKYWSGALYGYKALLLIFGVFLAWETRKVNIPALNDSKLIGLCVYNVVLLAAIGFGTHLVLTTDPSLSFLFSSAIMIFGTSVVLVIIFIPKMISVIQFPEGKPVTTMRRTTNAGAGNVDGTEESAELRTNVEQLESQLKELQKECPRCQRSGCGFWCVNVICGCCNGKRLKLDDETVVESSLATETIQ